MACYYVKIQGKTGPEYDLLWLFLKNELFITTTFNTSWKPSLITGNNCLNV